MKNVLARKVSKDELAHFLAKLFHIYSKLRVWFSNWWIWGRCHALIMWWVPERMSSILPQSCCEWCPSLAALSFLSNHVFCSIDIHVYTMWWLRQPVAASPCSHCCPSSKPIVPIDNSTNSRLGLTNYWLTISPQLHCEFPSHCHYADPDFCPSPAAFSSDSQDAQCECSARQVLLGVGKFGFWVSGA